MPFHPKRLRTPRPVELAGRMIKPYHVDTSDTPLSPAMLAAAYDALPGLLPAPDDGTPPAGFAVVHRGGDSLYVNAYAWVWGNVIECRVAAAGQPYLGCPDTDPTHLVPVTRPVIGCVWELPALAHERTAWVRHVLVPDGPDLGAYLDDTLTEGAVGA